MNTHIIEYLNYYVELKNPQYAVLLKGNWGSGKTYFIKKLIEVWKGDSKDDSEDTINLKPLYVSLNGVSKTSTINQLLRAEINPILYSKGAKVAKNIGKFVAKAALRFNFDADSDGKADGTMSFDLDELGIFKSKDSNVKGKRILIFDDVERCKIPTDEIFGYINNFVEHSECKVILLTDEEKIINKYRQEIDNAEDDDAKPKTPVEPTYKDFKEKLIGQTFEVVSDIENAVDYFIKQSEGQSKTKHLSNNKDLIISIFDTSKLQNLRVLRQGLLDFGRFTTYVDSKFKQADNYDEFIRNLLAYFIIVYAELKTGNDEVRHFQSYMHLFNSREIAVNDLQRKYQGALEANNIIHSRGIIKLNDIANYIESGYINSQSLTIVLSANHFFREEVQPAAWDQLWRWPYLNDAEFKVLKKNVWEQFRDGQITDVRVLFHIVGILLDLKENDLIKLSETSLLNRAKKTLRSIFRNTEDIKRGDVFNAGNGAFQKGYLNYTEHLFVELKSYFEELIKERQNRESDDFIKNIFDNLNAENFDEIYTKIKEPLADGTRLYEQTPFLSELDVKELSRKLKRFNNFMLRRFNEFINYRYRLLEPNRALDQFYKVELPFIESLKIELSSRRSNAKKLQALAFDEIDNTLENAIEKLNNI